MRLTTGLRVLLLVALTLAGCGGDIESRTFQAGHVELVDETGLVTAATAVDRDMSVVRPDTPTVTNPNGKLDRLLVVWPGDACTTTTRVTLSGNALTMRIEPHGRDDCEGFPVTDGVQMDLNRVVDVTSIDVGFVTAP